MKRAAGAITGAAALAFAAPAQAADERLELWLNPTVVVELDDKNFVELETAQRFRGDGADDTYFFRGWIGREIADDVDVSVGIERRFEGNGRETRLLQQIGYPIVGPLEGRSRMEQRFIEGQPQTGWRFRQRLGGNVPLSDKDNGWELTANVEGFFTLRGSNPTAQTGLTAYRAFVGVEKEFGNLELTIGYQRAHQIRDNARDIAGNAPFIGLELEL